MNIIIGEFRPLSLPKSVPELPNIYNTKKYFETGQKFFLKNTWLKYFENAALKNSPHGKAKIKKESKNDLRFEALN